MKASGAEVKPCGYERRTDTGISGASGLGTRNSLEEQLELCVKQRDVLPAEYFGDESTASTENMGGDVQGLPSM